MLCSCLEFNWNIRVFLEVPYKHYAEQVRLLVRLLPAIAEEEVFALKGGSAINLFYRDMPRLSVDIDLVYLPVESRSISLSNIDLGVSP